MKKVLALVDLIRPKQWIKNLFIFLPVFFAGKMNDIEITGKAITAFAVFCLMAGVVYIINDLKDVESDRAHSIKKNRPLARRAISANQAMCFAFFLFVSALSVSFFFTTKSFFILILVYFTTNVLYSFWLKHIPIVDIVIIASGFLLRIYAGSFVTGIANSYWITLLTFVLALFLALGKRYDDLCLDESGSGHARIRNLDGYNIAFVTFSMSIVAAVAIVSYILYTVSPEMQMRYHSSNLYLTSFWVIIGFLRYGQLTIVQKRSGSPTQLFWSDPFLASTVIAWILMLSYFIYVVRV
ncbi:MAG: UbiA prenyltransferase family protein [Fidelibacterota bacterium]|nr:MAG: UbiA prenyltransferase family protein [Candidatus Neomarinimicrobiota bacterium]